MSDLINIFINKKIVFLDLDGTIYMGNKLIKGADVFLKTLTNNCIAHYFLSNNSSRSKTDYIEKLAGMGISSSKDQIILSTDGVIEYLGARSTKNTYVVGTSSMKDMFLEAGIETESANPEYVVLGYDTELTYEKLRSATLFIQNGIQLLVTHCDIVCPSPDGPLPDAGAILALFEKATGRKAEIIFGKPNPDMVGHIIQKHQAKPEHVLMIGDRTYTDVELAHRLRCDSILVFSGETKPEDLKSVSHQPTLAVKSVADLISS